MYLFIEKFNSSNQIQNKFSSNFEKDVTEKELNVHFEKDEKEQEEKNVNFEKDEKLQQELNVQFEKDE